MTWIAFLFLLYGISWALVGLYREYAVDKGMLDQPNERSSHYAATPRGGGIVFFLCWIALVGTYLGFQWVSWDSVKYFVPVLLIGFVGFLDDRTSLSASIRFICQCIAATAFLFLIGEGGTLIQPLLNLPLPICFVVMVLGMVWMTNLYNFMDGSDGMASQQAIFFFAMAGMFLFKASAPELGIFAWGLMALLCGFLTWNWPTARIFMGDSGSCFLGFIMASYALVGHKYYDIPLTVWAILTSLFWFDATVTLVRRMLKRENWRKAHRLHAYQRLIQFGWSHQRVLVGAIGVNCILATLAWVAYCDPRLEMFSLGLSVAVLACLYLMVEVAKPMYGTWYEAK